MFQLLLLKHHIFIHSFIHSLIHLLFDVEERESNLGSMYEQSQVDMNYIIGL